MIPLTIMSDVNGSARSKDGENARIIEAGSVCGAELDLEAETEGINTRACQVTQWVTYLGAVERWARSNGIDDDEAVLGEGAQYSTGIVEEFECLVTGVGNAGGDPQVLQSVDLGVWGRCFDGQARGSGDDDRRNDESSGENMKRRVHRDVGGEGGW